ncbi:MAG: YjjG family noncanonical pyrimidine nucleotidase [Bacteroidales bacterium]
MKYSNLFIDLDDTLWDTRENMRVSLEELYDTHNLNSSFDSFDHFHSIYFSKNQELWHMYHHGQILKSQLIVERFKYPFLKVGVDISDLYAETLNSDFIGFTTTKTRLIPHAVELLEYLAPNYKMHILSNGFREAQYRKLKNSGLLEYFDNIILSDDIGYNKPHPEIFAHALRSTNTKKSQALMIGDNFDADITGAHNSKIDQIYFRNGDTIEMKFKPTYVVDALSEIELIL